MEKKTLQTTVKGLEEFLTAYFQKTGNRPSMTEALDMMAKNNLLTTHTPVYIPKTGADRSVEDICAMIDAQAIDASAWLQSTTTAGRGPATEEDAMFPQGRDVVISRLFPYLSTQPRQHAYFEVIVTLTGTSEVFFDGVPLMLHPGDLVIIPPQTPHIIAIHPNSYVFAINTRRSTFDAQFGSLMTNTDVMSVFFRESLYGMRESNYLHMSTDLGEPELLGILHSLVHECSSGEALANLCATSWLKLFLAHSFRIHGESISVLRSGRDEATRADCGAILQYIQHNYRTVRLSSLARTFHYNETYLSRMLQNYMGMSFTEIVRGIKMTRAEDYLTNSNLRIHEISALVGYDSVDHFSRTFKATHDMSPQAYRRRALAKNARAIEE